MYPDHKTTTETYISFYHSSAKATCVGKNIGLLEITKTVPQVVRYLDFELENKGEWMTSSNLFVKPTNFTRRIKRRAI